MTNELSADLIRELFKYDPHTGVVTRAKTKSSNAKVGSVVGHRNVNGYLMTRINGRTLSVHRLVWMYVYGEFPNGQIDHINGCKSDNRISNLRCGTRAENQQNQKLHSDNTSGYTGVSWRKDSNKWKAQIQVDGRKIHLGSFVNIEDAVAAHAIGKARYHKFQPFVREMA